MGVAALLAKILGPELGRTAIGAGLGGALGYAAGPDEDPSGAALAGAGLGALGAIASRGRRIAPQFALEGPLAADVGAWNAPRVQQEASFNPHRSNWLETVSPWFNISEDSQETANATRALLGGGSAEFSELDGAMLLKEAQKLQDEGLFDPWRQYAGYGTVPRAWDLMQEHRGRALAALGRGGIQEQSNALKEIQRIDQLTTQRKVATHEMEPEAAAAHRATMEAQLGPEKFARVQGFHDMATEMLRKYREATAQEGLITPEFNTRLQAQDARGEKYFPAFKRGPENEFIGDSVLGDQIIQGMRARGTAGQAAAKSLNVRGVEDLFQELKGSTLPLEDPWVALNVTLQEQNRRVKENRLMRGLIESTTGAKRADGTPFLRPLRPGEGPDATKGEGTVSFMVGGEAREFAVPAEYANLLQLGSAQSAAAGLKTLSRFQRINSALITSLNPAYVAANLTRDLSDSVLMLMRNPKDGAQWMKFYGESLLTSFRETLPDWLEALKGDMPEWREAFLRHGGANATLSGQLGAQPKWMDLVNVPGGGQSLLNRIQSLTKAIEEAPKVAEFRQQRGKGMTDIQAAGHARYWAGSPDFALSGAKTAAIKPWVMFWNPAIQGLYRVADHAQQHPEKVAQAAGVVGLGYIMQQQWNAQFKDEEGRPFIETIPEHERANNIIIFHGPPITWSNGVVRPEYTKIPIGHYGRLLLAPIRAAVDNLAGDKYAPGIKQSALNIGSNLSPINANIEASDTKEQIAAKLASGLNPLARVPLEMAANQSFYSGIPIEGRGLANRLEEDRYTPNTSNLARKLGGLTGTSPAYTDYAIRNFLPGLGDLAIRATELGREPKPLNLPEQVRASPLIGSTLSRFVGGNVDRNVSELTEQLYGSQQRAQEATTSLNRAEAAGDIDRMQDINRDYETDMLVAPTLRDLAKDLSEIRGMLEYLAMQPRTPERDAQMIQLGQLRNQIIKGNAPIIELTNRD